MISITRLSDGVSRGLVVFDPGGDVLDIDLPSGMTSPALLVEPVTDAVKHIEAGRIESLDRDQMWVVQAIVLGADLLAELGDREMTVEELMAAVKDLGHTWQVSPVSGP